MKSDLEDLLNYVDSRIEGSSADSRFYDPLKTIFGFSAFRPHQLEIVKSIISGKNVFATLPTGYGKSLCFQLPALLCDGMTIVVSPLISLMKNQVDQLISKGYRAVACINSHVPEKDQRNIMGGIERGELKLLYVSPERFRSPSFVEDLERTQISTFVIDEAHCISQWGHDFRPDYLALSDVIGRLRPHSVALFTATVTEEIEKDILKQLRIVDVKRYVASPVRPNLRFTVLRAHHQRDKFAVLSRCLDFMTGKGIIYVPTRSGSEEVAAFLKYRGIASNFYHAGRSRDDREAVQDAFFDDGPSGLDVVSATSAFGLGIDKRDIRFVVHFAIPGNIETYYQEAGRAGRDGNAAECILIYCEDDIRLQKWFIQRSAITLTDLKKVRLALESSVRYQKFRWVTPGELGWKTGMDPVKTRVVLSHLKRLGFARLHPETSLTLTIDIPSGSECEVTQSANLPRLPRYLHLPQYCQENSLTPTDVMGRLYDARRKGLLQFESHPECSLVECLYSAEYIEQVTEEQLGMKDFLGQKNNQLNQMIHYAVSDQCRQSFICSYLEKAPKAEYRCGLCDICQKKSAPWSRETEAEQSTVNAFWQNFGFSEDDNSFPEKQSRHQVMWPRHRNRQTVEGAKFATHFDEEPFSVKRIVCLANSRKYAGWCVAGKEVTDDQIGFWVRPVGRRENGELHTGEIVLADGNCPRPLDILQIPVADKAVHPFQSENYFVNPNIAWRKEGSYRHSELGQLCDAVDSLWMNGNSSFNGVNDRIPFETAQSEIESSLLLIEPESFVITVTWEMNKKTKVRGKFVYKDERYWLAVTDPQVEEKYADVGIGEYLIPGNIFLTISIGEPYHGYCYKLIAGVLSG